MKITHVIRGDDHINNTPRQINILRALGATPPLYAHVSMILGSDGKRLSKRHGAVGVMQFREDGFLPEALLNDLVRLGWSHGDQEIFSREELVSLFDLHGVNKAPAAFDMEKLLWLNQHYLKTSLPEHVATELAWHMQRLGIDITHGPSLAELVRVQAERVKTVREMAEKSRYFYSDISYNMDACKKHFSANTELVLTTVRQLLEKITTWNKEAIHQVIAECVEKLGIKMGQIAQPLRIAVTGDTISPSIDVTLALLGREKTLARINQTLEKISEGFD
jgi:glutamyl-tRNA synthetase